MVKVLLLTMAIFSSLVAVDFGVTSVGNSYGLFVEGQVAPSWGYTASVTREDNVVTRYKTVFKNDRGCYDPCAPKLVVKPNKVVISEPQVEKEVVEISTLSQAIKGEKYTSRLSFNYIYKLCPKNCKGLPTIGVGFDDRYKDDLFATIGYKVQYNYKKLVATIGYEFDYGQGNQTDNLILAQLGWRF